ncbi:MAG: insulinase family protein [Alphaproteobacteria bacterium]|nr:insulinase family protein [Alphaproteobacteria bacterium]
MSAAILIPTLLLACGPKAPPTPVVDSRPFDHRLDMPEPLAPREFQLPQAEEATLSNGLRVVLVENHEVPLVWVQVGLRAGAWTDPHDQPGLASVTMDMLNEGAAGKTAAQLSNAQRKLGSTVGSSAGLDSATVSASGLREKLPETLDLMVDVLRHPDFPADEWSLMQKKRIQTLKANREDPRSIGDRVWEKLGFGDGYAGHQTTEAAYQAMTVKDMKRWYEANVGAQNAVVLVGGDTTMAEIQPLLEARLADWGAAKRDLVRPTDVDEHVIQPEATTIYLVDKPGAAQSVLRVGRFVGKRTDADAPAFQLHNMAVGGMFTARINMNLREDKGWTYGAWSWVDSNYATDRWQVGTSVMTPATADAVSEILREVAEAGQGHRISQAELDNGRGYLLGTWPLGFENPGKLMSETEAMWLYDLPDDWITGAPDRLRAVSLGQAHTAWDTWVRDQPLAILVVGDAATVGEPLSALGLPIVKLDADGHPLQATLETPQ